jgi:hypothetical protein
MRAKKSQRIFESHDALGQLTTESLIPALRPLRVFLRALCV